MTDSLRPAKLVCPNCGEEVRVDVPRVLSLVYACGKCGVSVEHSFLTGTVAVVKTERTPDSSD